MDKHAQGVCMELAVDFKAAMRRLATTVTIITASSGEQRHGMTATAVSSLTTAPPSLLVCVNQLASIHDPIGTSGQFCINLLACDHHYLVPIFSGKMMGEERFASGDWVIDETGIPCLADAQANMFCTVVQRMSYGSHSIFIGAVNKVLLFGATSPLLYQEGALFKTVAIQTG